jgi:hypothetical protein
MKYVESLNECKFYVLKGSEDGVWHSGITGSFDFVHHPVFEKTQRFRNWFVPVCWLRLALSNGPQREGVSHPLTWGWK